MALFALSDAGEVALITCVFNLAVLLLSRWMSHHEHKKTERKVDSIYVAVNGKT